MTITLKIDNPDIEEQFVFKKKDPRKHSRKIKYIDEENEDLSDVKPYSHVEDSAKYIHNLRREG